MLNNNFARRFAAVVCTVVMSATCLVAAVGPAHNGGKIATPVILTA